MRWTEKALQVAITLAALASLILASGAGSKWMPQ